MKCQCCKAQEAEWAWQPFGPGENANEFTLIGNHTRGFPVVKVCFACKGAFQSGDFPVSFKHEGRSYVGENHQVLQDRRFQFVAYYRDTEDCQFVDQDGSVIYIKAKEIERAHQELHEKANHTTPLAC